MTTRRTARWMATPLAAALLLAPASGAFAQDGDTQTTEDTTVVTEESTSDAAAALQVLEAQLTDLALTLAGLGDEDTEARANVEALLATAADEISLGVTVISAKADRDEDGDIADDEAEAFVASLEDDEDDEDDADGGHGDLVRQVAECAPRGQQTVGFLGGLKNHGKWVSAAAHGDTVEMAIPDLSTGVVEGDDGELTLTSTVVSFDLSDPLAVADLCSAFAVLAQANELLAEATGEDLPKKNDAKKAERNEAKDQRKADRDEAKAERDAAKADRKAGESGDDSDDDGDESDDD